MAGFKKRSIAPPTVSEKLLQPGLNTGSVSFMKNWNGFGTVHSFSICLLLACFILVSGIHPASAITVKEEEALSREIFKKVIEQYPLVDDRRITEYVNRMGYKIVNGLPSRSFEYEFYVIQSSDYNAFAIPGGKIFIHSGLMEAMTDESELVGILGHEIAHVVCRHISERIDRGPKLTMISLAGMIAGALLAANGEGEVGQALTVGSMAAGQTMELSYSREDEMQADQLGLKYLQKAGYNAEGLLSILKKIRSRQLFGSGQIPTYMLTHPAIDDRIIYLSSWTETHQSRQQDDDPEAADRFKKMRIRLLSLYGDEKAALNELKNRLEQGGDNYLAHNGYGLLMARAGNRKESARHFKQALETKAFDADILANLGMVYFQDGLYDEARKALEGAVSIDPNCMDGLFYLGRTCQQLGNNAEAVDIFKSLYQQSPHYKDLSFFLGEAYGKSGDLELAHYHLGLYHYGERDFDIAEFHLNRALQLAKDGSVRRGEIETLLNKIRKHKVREAEEKKKKKTPNFYPQRSKWENFMLNVPRPWVAERNGVE